MLSVKRVTRPDSARPPRVRLTQVDQAAYQAIQTYREEMLVIVHDEVQRYLSTPELVFEAGGGFPSIPDMTGEYYIGDEGYTAHPGPWYQISIMARFQGPRLHEQQTCFDYLGLEVWLRHDPVTREFSIYRNTDSSVI